MNKTVNEIIANVETKDIKQIYITGALGGFTSHDFRLIIFNEKPMLNKDTETIELIRDPKKEIIMSFSTIKEINEFLTEHINEFEKKYGNIKVQIKR